MIKGWSTNEKSIWKCSPAYGILAFYCLSRMFPNIVNIYKSKVRITNCKIINNKEEKKIINSNRLNVYIDFFDPAYSSVSSSARSNGMDHVYLNTITNTISYSTLFLVTSSPKNYLEMDNPVHKTTLSHAARSAAVSNA